MTSSEPESDQDWERLSDARPMRPSIKAQPSAARQACGPQRGALQLLVWEPVLTEIVAFSESMVDREQAGFLLGGWHGHSPEDASQFVEIRGFLPARHTRQRATSVTFTYDTWTAMRRELAARSGAEVVVGWQHTHPGMGVFLSEFDRFIHRHFFGQPWQVAMVVDPLRKEMGFFQWNAGRLAGSGFVCLSHESGG